MRGWTFDSSKVPIVETKAAKLVDVSHKSMADALNQCGARIDEGRL